MWPENGATLKSYLISLGYIHTSRTTEKTTCIMLVIKGKEDTGSTLVCWIEVTKTEQKFCVVLKLGVLVVVFAISQTVIFVEPKDQWQVANS